MASNPPGKSFVTDLLDFVQNEGYRPGDRLPSIRQLSATLGFGRNAIRDGLLEAQTMGFVKVEPRLGVFVQDTKPAKGSGALGRALEHMLSEEQQNLFHLVDARLLVESELAAEAARIRRAEDLLPLRQALEAVLTCEGDRLDFIKADRTFHLAIAQIAGNRVLLAFLQVLWQLIGPAKSTILLSAENRELTDREHQELFQSIAEGDVEKSRATMRTHIGQGRDLLLKYVRTPIHAGE